METAEAEKANTLDFRPYQESDINCIRSNWASSFYSGVRQHKHIHSDDFHRSHRAGIDRFFTRPTATVIICTIPSEPDVINGWIAVETLRTGIIIHYLYVKYAFKNEGIAKMLLNRVSFNSPIFYTHKTDRSDQIMKRNPIKYGRYIYAPSLF